MAAEGPKLTRNVLNYLNVAGFIQNWPSSEALLLLLLHSSLDVDDVELISHKEESCTLTYDPNILIKVLNLNEIFNKFKHSLHCVCAAVRLKVFYFELG